MCVCVCGACCISLHSLSVHSTFSYCSQKVGISEKISLVFRFLNTHFRIRIQDINEIERVWEPPSCSSIHRSIYVFHFQKAFDSFCKDPNTNDDRSSFCKIYGESLQAIAFCILRLVPVFFKKVNSYRYD